MIKNFSPNKREIIDKGIKVFFIRVIGYAFGFLFTWVVANKYGAKIQGIFSLAFLFLSVGAMIAKLGVETALVKWIANAAHVIDKKNIYFKAISLIGISSFLIGLLLFLIAPFIALMFNKPNLENSIRLAAVAIPFLSILDVSGSYFKGEKLINTYGLYFHFIKFLFPFVIISIFYFLSVFTFEAPILAYLLGLFLASTVIVIHVMNKLKGQVSYPNKEYSFKKMFLESYPMMISSAIVMIMGWSDVFILGFYVSEEKIGVYSTAIKIATMVSFTYNAIATIATPKIASFFYKKQEKELKETISFSSKMMFLCGIPIFLGIFCFPEFILNIFGDEYIIGKKVLRILAIAQLTNIMTGPVGPIFQMTGKQKLLQKFIMISLMVNVILSLILVHFFNMEGVALGSAIGMMSWNIMGARYLKTHMNIQTWIRI